MLSPFPPSVFLFRYVSHSLSLPFFPCLGCILALIGMPFLRSLLRIIHVVVFLLFVLLFVFVFVFLVDMHFIFYLLCVPSWRRCPWLATSLSVFFCLLSSPFFSEHVHGLIWFGSVYFVTTAEIVADVLM